MDKPLLVIEVHDLNAVPIVKYKGVEVTGKMTVDYRWRTRSSEDDGSHEITIEHVDKQGESACHKEKR